MDAEDLKSSSRKGVQVRPRSALAVDALVNMSQISAREDSNSPLARQHWLSERILT